MLVCARAKPLLSFTVSLCDLHTLYCLTRKSVFFFDIFEKFQVRVTRNAQKTSEDGSITKENSFKTLKKVCGITTAAHGTVYFRIRKPRFT